MAETWKKIAYEDDVVLKSLFDAQSILAATADDTPAAVTFSEQQVAGRLTGGDFGAIDIGITDDDIVQIDGSPNSGEHAVFTDSGIDGKTDAELIALLSGDAAAAFDWNGQALQNFTMQVVADDAAKTALTAKTGMIVFQTDAACFYACTEGE